MYRSIESIARGICVALAAATVAGPASAALQQGATLQPSDPVNSIEFTLYVGQDGEALAEPVALDLGLGFPFWLAPIGQDEGQQLPVGAIPQEAAAQRSLQAGQSARFVFRRDGDPGSDTLRTSPQLLDGVQVADIARVGILSRGSGDWELARYELKINGQLFAANDAVHRKAARAIEEAESAWSELQRQLEPLVTERDDLRTLQQAGLAVGEETARLEAIVAEMAPLEARKARLEGVLRGVAPWFIEEGVRVPGRAESAPISRAQVTLVTAAHTNADTYNYIYFRTGARKFFLFPRDNHFSPDAGPQEFQLDLAGGALTAADVRGFGLGMLAHRQPYADVPDRWHPQRLIVQLDGRTTYDSEAEPVDRLSLDAIRIIPPAHLNQAGEIQGNEPNPLECFVWLSGRAQGLDLANGGPVVIDGDAPGSEPVDPLSGEGDDPFDSPGGEGVAGQDGGYWDGEEPIPGDPWGECPLGGDGDFAYDDGYDDDLGDYDYDYDPGYGDDDYGWGDYGDDGYGGDDYGDYGDGGGLGPGGMPFPDPGAGTPSEQFFADLADFIERIFTMLGLVPENPPNIGEPPQIDPIELVRDGQQYRVLWDVTGDETRVTSFVVELYRINPETDELEFLDVDEVPYPQMRASKWFDLSDLAGPTDYILPYVTAVLDPDDPSAVTGDAGPALPWLPAGADPTNQPQLARFEVHSADSDRVAEVPEADSADGVGATVRKQRVVSTQNGTLLASYGATVNAVVGQPWDEAGDVVLRYTVEEPLDPALEYDLICYMGFVQEPAGEGQIDVGVDCTLFRAGRAGSAEDADRQDVSSRLPVDRVGTPRLFTTRIDPTRFPEGVEPLSIAVTIPEGSTDPDAPLAIYGMRLVPVSP